jgi:hypothetical protein
MFGVTFTSTFVCLFVYTPFDIVYNHERNDYK